MVSVSALVAPKFKLIVALLVAMLTIFLVPYPYTYQSSDDGEAIPSIYELTGAVVGGVLATAVVFFRSKRV
jgi:hypothetical protein